MESHRDRPKSDGKGDLGRSQAEEIRLPDSDTSDQPDNEPDEEFEPYPIEHTPPREPETFRLTAPSGASFGT